MSASPPILWFRVKHERLKKILDGVAVVQMLPPKLANTFQEYADIFLPYTVHQLEMVEQFDVVLDVYVANNFRAAARQQRGSGVRRRVIPSARIPGNWKGFLRVRTRKNCFLFWPQK